MAVSEFFTDEDLCTQIRLQFDEDGQWDTDLRLFLNNVIDRGGDYYLEFRNRRFSIDKITGAVTDLDEGGSDE